jgi:Na+-translocating ferredoxin:NAD+ oxidoreductase RnfE subunit
MLRKVMPSGLSIVYIMICILTLASAYFLVSYFEAFAYDVVSVFIALIVLSNCLAKMYIHYVGNRNV